MSKRLLEDYTTCSRSLTDRNPISCTFRCYAYKRPKRPILLSQQLGTRIMSDERPPVVRAA